MTPAEMEAERRALVKAIVTRLQNPAPGTSPLGADAEPFANEVVAMAVQLGWRPTLARPSPPWQQQVSGPRGGLDPEVLEALRHGNYQAVRDAYGTTSVAPTPRTAEDNGNEEDR